MELTRDILLDDERRLMLESVADYRKSVLDEAAREMDESPAAGKVEEAWKKAGSLGLTSLLISEEAGGQGMDAYSFCLVMSELARASAGFGVLLLSHNLALWVLEKAGLVKATERVVRGNGLAALAWPFHESDGAGESAFVPGGAAAGLLVMVSGSGDLFTVTSGTDAVEVEEIPYPLGLRASRPACVTVGTVRDLETSGKIGSDNAGELECRLLIGAAALSLGLSRRAYEKAYGYASERYQAGDLIVNHQQIQLMLADMLVGLEAGEAVLRQATEGAGGAGFRLSTCRAAKVFAAEKATAATLDGVQIHGGYGYMRDYGMERLVRDAKYCQTFPRPPQEEALSVFEEMG